ncbi:uncharacterized protein LOC143287739 isoform X2 [Babylonia areolata]|uniref:uncharacterized protein LOC143287739 isoform X2 n=1 Tax=Babylonia areolata TaxID=304850 RepID=UPI003FCF8118
MARRILKLSLFLLLLLEVRTQAQHGGAAAAAPPPAAGAGAGAGAGTGAAGAAAPGAAGARGALTTRTTSPKHVFCTRPPMARTPKMPIFHMQVNTGFYNGYRSNQSVVVEITAKYPEVWRINQFFIHVPDNDPYVYRARTMPGFVRPKNVGHWMWNLRKNNNTDPNIGGSQPVDCGGMTSYGPFGMLSSMGAHAAKEITPVNMDPSNPHKGYSTVEAKWVPPTNWENIMNRKMITIEAFVTFEKTPPGTGHYHNPYNFHYHHHHHHQAMQPARWVKKTASLLNLDYIDIHNYMMRFRPYMNMMQKFMTAIKK